MCGIAGIIDIEGEREIDRNALERMTTALAHRGPDGHGYHIEPGVGFGHRRLAIIDVAGGQQPFTSSTGKTVITFNGEIYNYLDSIDEISANGRVLRTRSDTEVLAELIDMRGPEALPALNGMFAFAAWSPRNETLLLARDRLGEKPLYYHITDDGFLLFASEIDALIASKMVPTLIDETAVADYFFYGYVPDPKTIYTNVFKLPPAHFISFRRGQKWRGPIPWWSVKMVPDDDLTFDNAVQSLMPLLDEVVRSQMISDEPIAAFLSGGVDSGAIATAMAKSTPTPITTCTMGFDDPNFDERHAADRVAALIESQHHDNEVSCDAAEHLRTIAAVFGEPFADTSALPTYLLCKLTKKYAKVALSGDGGDEVFAGYDRYAGVLREARLRRLFPNSARQGLVGPIGPDLS